MKRKIQRAVDFLLSEWAGELPVDVKTIANTLGIAVHHEVMEDPISGMLILQDQNPVIVVNEHHHENRQRFTIAHELGHYCLHRWGSLVFIDSRVYFRDGDSSAGMYRQEIEANAVAAAVLMPEAALRDLLGNQPLDPYDDDRIEELAATFRVSTQAMTIRLTKLDLIETVAY